MMSSRSSALCRNQFSCCRRRCGRCGERRRRWHGSRPLPGKDVSCLAEMEARIATADFDDRWRRLADAVWRGADQIRSPIELPRAAKARLQKTPVFSFRVAKYAKTPNATVGSVSHWICVSFSYETGAPSCAPRSLCGAVSLPKITWLQEEQIGKRHGHTIKVKPQWRPAS